MLVGVSKFDLDSVAVGNKVLVGTEFDIGILIGDSKFDLDLVVVDNKVLVGIDLEECPL